MLLRVATAVFTLLFLAGCASHEYQFYPGQKRAPEEVATVVIPEAIDLLSLDNREPKSYVNFFRKGKMRIDLLPGEHQMVLEYNQIFDIDSDNHESIVSEPVAITFTAQANTTYKVIPPRPENIEEARMLEEELQLTLTDQAGDEQFVSVPLVNKPEFTLSQKPEPVTPDARKGPASTAPSKRTDEAVTPLSMLKFWWQQANESERQAFGNWQTQADKTESE